MGTRCSFCRERYVFQGLWGFSPTSRAFPFTPGTPVQGTEFDIAPDGERFLFLSIRAESTEAEGLVFVEHWFEELRARVPTQD